MLKLTRFIPLALSLSISTSLFAQTQVATVVSDSPFELRGARVNPSLAVNNYDLDAEYSRSLLDVPHRLVLAPIFELPFGVLIYRADSDVADALAIHVIFSDSVK